MTDFNPNVAQQPDLLVQGVGLVTRHGLTVLAGMLGEHGLLSTDQQTQFVSLGVSIALGAAALAWSYIQKRNAKKAVGQ